MSKLIGFLNALAQISPMPEDDKLTEKLLLEYEIITRQIFELKDPRSIAPLMNSFGYGDGFGLYWGVVHFLEEFEPEILFPFLIDSLKKGYRGTKMWAAYMLGRCRSAEAVDDLISILNDENEFVRLNAIMALGMIGDVKAKEHLEVCLKDISVQVGDMAKQVIDDLH